jgi:hypothetical protein
MGQKLRRILVGGAVGVSAFAGVAMTTVGPAWAYGPKPTPKTITLTYHNTAPDGVSDGPTAKAAVPAASSGGLAFTGTDVALTSSAGAAAVAAGGMIVLASRKRRQKA